MQNPPADLKNDTLTPMGLCIQTDHLISARRPDLIVITKKKKKRSCKIVDFAVPTDHMTKLKESKKKDEYIDPARELKKNMEHDGDYNTKRDCCIRYNN